LVFVVTGFDFVADGFDFVPPGLEFYGRYSAASRSAL
jgi:hypothetical protein